MVELGIEIEEDKKMKMKLQAGMVQNKIDEAWSVAYKNRPLFEERYDKLDDRWYRFNDFCFTETFEKLTEEQQDKVNAKMEKTLNELNAVAAALDAFEKIMLAIEDFDCAIEELKAV